MKNYTFRAIAPHVNGQSVADQMLAAHRYRNVLCQLERKRREDSEDTIKRLSPEYSERKADYEAASERLDNAYSAVNDARAESRTRQEATKEQKQEIAAARQELRQASDLLKKAKTAAYKMLAEKQKPYMVLAEMSIPWVEGVKPATRKQAVRTNYLERLHVDDIDAGQYEYENAVKAARAARNCYWGTGGVVEEACKDFNKGAPPAFKRWDGSGTIAVQFQGGFSVKEAIACTGTQLQIELKNEEELLMKGDSHHKRAQCVIRMRIGSDGRMPIWAEFKATIHRMIPEDGDIRYAYLHRVKRGHGYEWKFRLTINSPSHNTAVSPPDDSSESVVLHVGWRTLKSGDLRTAVWVGSDGATGEIVLTKTIMERDQKIHELQSQRDSLLNDIRPVVADWLSECRSELSEQWAEKTESIGKWRSHDRFVSLCLWWRDNELPNDAAIQEYLEQWRKKDKHLCQQIERLKTNVIGQRTMLYRSTLKSLAGRYAEIVIADIDQAKLAEKERPDEEIVQTSLHRHNARLASPGMLTQYAKEYFGERVQKVDATNITPRCHCCKVVNEDLDRTKKDLRCAACGEMWDQDVNAAMNCLDASGDVRSKTRRASESVIADKESQFETSGRDVVSGYHVKTGTARKTRRNRKSSHGKE